MEPGETSPLEDGRASRVRVCVFFLCVALGRRDAFHRLRRFSSVRLQLSDVAASLFTGFPAQLGSTHSLEPLLPAAIAEHRGHCRARKTLSADDQNV